MTPKVNDFTEEAPYTAPPSSIDLAVLLHTLWCGKKRIGVTGLVAAGAVLVASLFISDTFTSSATLIPPTNSSGASISAQISSIGAGLLSGGLTKNQGDLYIGVLQSATVENLLIERFHLQDVYRIHKMSSLHKRLLGASHFEQDAKSSIITISVTDKSPERARDLVNGYLDALRSTNGRLAIVESSQRRLFFADQLRREKDQLADAEVELKRVQERTGLIAPSIQVSERIETVAQLRAQIKAREVELAVGRKSMTDNNSALVLLRSEIESLQNQLSQLLRAGDGTNPPNSQVPEVELEYVRRQREVKYHEALFQILAKQYEAARLDESNDAPVIQVLDAASFPDSQSGPHRILLTLGALVAGLLFECIHLYFRRTWPAFKKRVTNSVKDHIDHTQA